jgi:hypothetical protein
MTDIIVQIERRGRQAGHPERNPFGRRWDASERADTRRGQLRFAARALEVQSPVFGQAVELSAGGLRLESRSRLVTDARYVFRLSYGTRFLNLPGRVAWSELHRVETSERGRRAVYQTGVELDCGEVRSRWHAALADRAIAALDA